VKYLEQVASRLRKKHLSVKQKLQYLDRKGMILKYLKNVSDVTADFFLSQVRNQKLKPKGRRYNTNDKIFALSVYEQSGNHTNFYQKSLAYHREKCFETC
jgi:hypothetical protein